MFRRNPKNEIMKGISSAFNLSLATCLISIVVLGPAAQPVTAHTASVAIAVCETHKTNRTLRAERARYSRETRATNSKNRNMDVARAIRNVALGGAAANYARNVSAAWKKYRNTLKGCSILRLLPSGGVVATYPCKGAASSVLAADLAKATASNAAAVAGIWYVYNTKKNAYMSAWQDEMEAAEEEYDQKIKDIHSSYFTCRQNAGNHRHPH